MINNKVNEQKRLARTFGVDGEKDGRYYVYALIAENKCLPFYIGKGCGKRVFSHENAAEYVRKQIEENYSNPDERRKRLDMLESKKIKKLLKGRHKNIIVKWGLTEQEAFFAESALINAFEYSWSQCGDELSNIVRGHATEREKKSRPACSKAYEYTDFLKDVALEEKTIDDIKNTNEGNKTLLVNLSNTYRKILELESDGKLKSKTLDEAIMEASRGNWKIGNDSLNGANYVMALYYGKVVGIYRIKPDSAELVYEHGQNVLGQIPDIPNQNNLTDNEYEAYQKAIMNIRKKIHKARESAKEKGASWKEIKNSLDFNLTKKEKELLDKPSALDRRFFKCEKLKDDNEDDLKMKEFAGVFLSIRFPQGGFYMVEP